MKVSTVIIHKIQPENAWEQKILTQLGFPQIKKAFRRPKFLVKDSDLKRLLKVLSEQKIENTKNIVKKFNENKTIGKLSNKQTIELCSR